MSNIHETAIIDPSAKIHSSVNIGPYSIVGPDVNHSFADIINLRKRKERINSKKIDSPKEEGEKILDQ